MFEKGIFTAFIQHFFKKRSMKDFITLGFSFLLTLAIPNHWETQSNVIYDLNRLSESSARYTAVSCVQLGRGSNAQISSKTLFSRKHDQPMDRPSYRVACTQLKTDMVLFERAHSHAHARTHTDMHARTLTHIYTHTNNPKIPPISTSIAILPYFVTYRQTDRQVN